MVLLGRLIPALSRVLHALAWTSSVFLWWGTRAQARHGLSLHRGVLSLHGLSAALEFITEPDLRHAAGFSSQILLWGENALF